jgi:hypothetical protein
LEETLGHVETPIRTSGTLVHDRSPRALPVVSDRDRLEAVRTGVATAILRSVQRNNKVTRVVVLPASTKSDRIIREPSIIEPFMQLNFRTSAMGEVPVEMGVWLGMGVSDDGRRPRESE